MALNKTLVVIPTAKMMAKVKAEHWDLCSSNIAMAVRGWTNPNELFIKFNFTI